MIQREANSSSRALAIGLALCALVAWGAGRGGAQPAPAQDSQSRNERIQQHQEKMQQVLQENEGGVGASDAAGDLAAQRREEKIREHRERIRQMISERRDMGNPKTLAAIREKAATGKPYRIGEVAKASPQDNQAERFAVGENSYGIKDVLVFPDTAKEKMYLFVVFEDETFDGRSADMTTSKTLGFGLPQKHAVQVYLKWERNDGRTDLWFQTKASDAFGEEVSKRAQIVKREGLDQPIPMPGDDVDPKERGRIIQEAIQKRRDVQARLNAQIEALKQEFNMGPEW